MPQFAVIGKYFERCAVLLRVTSLTDELGLIFFQNGYTSKFCIIPTLGLLELRIYSILLDAGGVLSFLIGGAKHFKRGPIFKGSSLVTLVYRHTPLSACTRKED